MDKDQPPRYPHRTRTKRLNKKQRRSGVKERLRREKRRLYKESLLKSTPMPVVQEPESCYSSVLEAPTILNEDREFDCIIKSIDEEDRGFSFPTPLQPSATNEDGVLDSGLRVLGLSRRVTRTLAKGDQDFGGVNCQTNDIKDDRLLADQPRKNKPIREVILIDSPPAKVLLYNIKSLQAHSCDL